MPGARRADIVEAALRVIDRDGLRGLTHRAIDRELGLALGSTSYYARTRHKLIELVVGRMAARTSEDLAAGSPAAPAASQPAPAPAPALAPDGPPTPAAVAARLAALLDLLATRAGDARARFALSVDLVHDPGLHALLTHGSPIRERMLADSEAMLAALGVTDPDRRAIDLIALVDGLLYDRVAGAGAGQGGTPADAGSILTAYLEGLPRGQR